MNIYWATELRGFFKHLSSSSKLKHKFVAGVFYETKSRLRFFLGRVAKSRLFDVLGYIQIIKVSDKKCDIYGSYNRFLKTKAPYFIYLENPTALYHYRLRRIKSIFAQKIIKKALNDINLKAMIFMSQACAQTFDVVCSPLPTKCIRRVIYPYVPMNKLINENIIKNKVVDSNLKLLYISQGLRFLSKGGLEILEAYNRLRSSGLNVSLCVITSLSALDKNLIEKMKNTDGLELFDFNFSYPELEKIYASSHVLLQPTSDDSSPLTILEAMKSGLPIITTRLYAIPEMVEDGYNGFLIEPHYWFFDENNIPNPEVWNHLKTTIYSGRKSARIEQFLYDKITMLYEDRNLLCSMSFNSYYKSNSMPFSENYIASQWNEVLDLIKDTN